MVEGCGAEVLPLPRYSPDLSPIKPCWPKVKRMVKRARAQAVEASVEVAVGAVSGGDAEGWFRHCGYVHQSE